MPAQTKTLVERQRAMKSRVEARLEAWRALRIAKRKHKAKHKKAVRDRARYLNRKVMRHLKYKALNEAGEKLFAEWQTALHESVEALRTSTALLLKARDRYDESRASKVHATLEYARGVRDGQELQKRMIAEAQQHAAASAARRMPDAKPTQPCWKETIYEQ